MAVTRADLQAGRSIDMVHIPDDVTPRIVGPIYFRLERLSRYYSSVAHREIEVVSCVN